MTTSHSHGTWVCCLHWNSASSSALAVTARGLALTIADEGEGQVVTAVTREVDGGRGEEEADAAGLADRPPTNASDSADELLLADPVEPEPPGTCMAPGRGEAQHSIDGSLR